MVRRHVPALPTSSWYGIDPSTARAAVAWVDPAGARHVETVSFNTELRDGPRLDHIYCRTFEHVRRLHLQAPAGYVAVEQPFAFDSGNGNRVEPVSYFVVGVIMLAAARATGALVEPQRSPASWKAGALGKGHGRARKPEILAWARAECGYAGNLQDEADALGIAVDASRRITFTV